MRDLFDAIPGAISKKLARDMRGYFAVQECVVEAVVSTFYGELRGNESGEERGYNAPP